MMRGWWHQRKLSKEDNAKARALYERAIAALFRATGQSSEEIAAVESAAELDPNYAFAHGLLDLALIVSGRPEEAIAPEEKALRLDPRNNPQKALWLSYMSWAHLGAGRYEEAVDWAKQSVRVNPDLLIAHRALAVSNGQLGRIDEARAAVAGELRIDPGLTLEKAKRQIAVFNPDAHPDFIERQIDGLRKAGLPE